MGWRAIHSSVAESESLASISPGAERLFWRMLACSDTYGRLPGKAAKIRARCMPLVLCTNEEVDAWLGELDRVDRVLRYQADGADLVAIVDFDEYQPREFLRRRGKPEFPGPDETTLFAGESEGGRSKAEEGPALGRNSPELHGSPPATEAEAEAEAEAEEHCVPNGTLSASADAVTAVFEHWKHTRRPGTSTRLTPNRRTKIRARLREHPPDVLCKAIDAIAIDERRWPERSAHDDLTVVFRSPERVEYFLALADHDQAAPAVRGERRGGGLSASQIIELGQAGAL